MIAVSNRQPCSCNRAAPIKNEKSAVVSELSQKSNDFLKETSPRQMFVQFVDELIAAKDTEIERLRAENVELRTALNSDDKCRSCKHGVFNGYFVTWICQKVYCTWEKKK